MDQKKDIVKIIGSIGILLVCLFFMYKFLFPEKPKAPVDTNVNNTAVQQDMITGKINEEDLKQLEKLKDYGSSNLDNIGKTNPFEPIQ